jgi:hypothetical protein
LFKKILEFKIMVEKVHYNSEVVERIREWLARMPEIIVQEKKMFRGVTFMVNDKMCVSVSGENLMCRFDPNFHDQVKQRKGFQKMMMRGRVYKAFCYVTPAGFAANEDFDYWLNLCLSFNPKARSSKK